MTYEEVWARICITLLVVFAGVVAVVAGVSAWRKWRAAAGDRRNAMQLLGIFAQYEVDVRDPEYPELWMSARKRDEAIAALDLAAGTSALRDANAMTNGGLTRGEYSVAWEIGFGVAAVVASAVAGIWDVWLT